MVELGTIIAQHPLIAIVLHMKLIEIRKCQAAGSLFIPGDLNEEPQFGRQLINIPIFFFYFSAPYVVAWKRGIAILSAGLVKVTPDERINLINGFSLQIKDAVPQDAGDYICQIATLEPREITHTVEILGKLQVER